MGKAIWNELVQNHWSKEKHIMKCESARKNWMTKKDGSITRHAGGSISFGAHRERMKKELGREVDPFEVFKRTHKKKQGTGEFVDTKSKRISENYRENLNFDDQSSHPSFDLSSWCDVAGCPTKGRVYGYDRDQNFERSCGASLFPAMDGMRSNEINNEFSKEIEEMRAARKKMEEEIEESKKKLECNHGK
ncbi:uncharacterized protein [Henckelia pumila]|uniref:uncharacterized protein n=1 Tax=Henckelia pumila TaxID=405737 RepID=UPI003C6E8B93